MVRGSIDEQTELIRVRELLSNFMAQQGLDMSEIVQHWATIVAVLEVMVQRIAGTMEYWSDIQPGVQIAAIAADVSLPSLPPATGALGLDQVHRVTFMMRFRSLNNPSVDPNRLDGEQVIQFSADEGDTWHNALVLPDEAFGVVAATRDGDGVVYGNIDLKEELIYGQTIRFRWNQAKADSDYLIFQDVQVGIRITNMMGV